MNTQFLNTKSIPQTITFTLLVLMTLLSGCKHEPVAPITETALTASDAGNKNESLISINWEAFKFPVFSERAGVSGTFDSYSINVKNKSANVLTLLEDAEILIETSSVRIGNSATKTSNVLNHFFAYFTDEIHGRVISMEETLAVVAITMNRKTVEVPFKVSIDEIAKSITFTGKIEDVNAYGAETAYSKLDEVCGEYHDGYVWPDVDLEIVVNNYDLL